MTVRQQHTQTEKTTFNTLFHADESTHVRHMMHKLNYVLLAGVPIAVVFAPSPLAKPVDLLLGVVLPLHAHVGLNAVITDYVPSALRQPARGAVLVTTLLVTLGLLRWNLAGDGMTASAKALWYKKPEASE
eukprot:CAMPEP_0196772744 /NCGR_PEP_ID=MMETSP1104-20130614/2397_1 /TAXON_ID=33652 /ORGANISM="Cafeteria sp., Strain Caron Lab Isolate" /LENGTH=130 /DNA_ID=CAMNT_0042142885 /DNA_START=116 /DNA_END=508 /DNA_ORIENTATION=+